MSEMLKRYTIGSRVCGAELKRYLSSLGLSERAIESIMEGVRSNEWKYTTIAIKLNGRAFDWDQYKEPPVGAMSKDVARRLVSKSKTWFKVELWEHEPPECMVLKDSMSIIGLLAPFSWGLRVK